MAARDHAVAKGITIKGLAIINEKTGNVSRVFLYQHTHPPVGLPDYYRNNVIGGSGNFVLHITNLDSFAEAARQEFGDASEISASSWAVIGAASDRCNPRGAANCAERKQ